jgi:hypothetical protein
MNVLKFSGTISRVNADQKLTFEKTSVSIIKVDSTNGKKSPKRCISILAEHSHGWLSVKIWVVSILSSTHITTDMDNTGLLTCILSAQKYEHLFKNNFKMSVETDMIMCG